MRAAQRVGMPLRDIAAALAELPDGRVPNRSDWARLSATWRAALTERIGALERLRDNLDDCIGCGCLSLDRCALANPGDTLAEPAPAPGACRILRIFNAWHRHGTGCGGGRSGTL